MEDDFVKVLNSIENNCIKINEDKFILNNNQIKDELSVFLKNYVAFVSLFDREINDLTILHKSNQVSKNEIENTKINNLDKILIYYKHNNQITIEELMAFKSVFVLFNLRQIDFFTNFDFDFEKNNIRFKHSIFSHRRLIDLIEPCQDIIMNDLSSSSFVENSIKLMFEFWKAYEEEGKISNNYNLDKFYYHKFLFIKTWNDNISKLLK